MSKLSTVSYRGKIKECGECGRKNCEAYDATSSEPVCTECADGEWEMRGDDPCGKNWES